MAHGGPTGDPRVAADLCTDRVWQRRVAAGKDLISVLLNMRPMPFVSIVRDTLAFILAVVASTTMR
eukprot:5056143-Amphidinium_carterae.1